MAVKGPTFTVSGFLPLRPLKIQAIQPKPQKKIVDLHKSSSFLETISIQMKVPQLSVQIIICKYNNFSMYGGKDRSF